MPRTLKADIARSLHLGRRCCTACGVEKAFDQFSACRRATLGVRNRCKLCVYAEEAARRAKNPECERQRRREKYKRDPAAAAERVKRWRLNNRERYRKWNKEYNKANPERVKAARAKNYDKVRGCPRYRLKAAMKAGIHQRMVTGKGGVSTFDALGYSVDELKSHLENQFSPGMTWENYGVGGWEIDHIVPLSALPAETVDCPNFRRAWALTNLQPLWASENRSKGNRVKGPRGASKCEFAF